MNFGNHINSIHELQIDDSYIRGYTNKLTNYESLKDLIYKANKHKLEKEHLFMDEAFNKFEAIRKKDGILLAGLFLHEQYKILHAERAKANLLYK